MRSVGLIRNAATISPRKAPSRRRREYTPPAVCTPTPAPRFISPENEAFIWQHMQQTTAEALEEQARLLRLPAKGLEYIARHPEQGGLALAPDGRLLVIYTANDDAGKLRITACKLRCWKDRTNYPAYLHAGEWTPGRKETDARFLWSAKNGIIHPTREGEQPRRIYAPTAPYGMQADTPSALRRRRAAFRHGTASLGLGQNVKASFNKKIPPFMQYIPTFCASTFSNVLAKAIALRVFNVQIYQQLLRASPFTLCNLSFAVL